MKVLLPLIALAYVASAQPRCMGPEPIECGKDEMNCPGGDDGMGCMMPDTCMPTKGGEYQVDNLSQKFFFLQNMGRTCCVQKLF